MTEPSLTSVSGAATADPRDPAPEAGDAGATGTSAFGDAQDPAILALFGHDLRAALSDVVGGLRLISPARLDSLTRAQIERVQSSAEGMARLLDQGLATLLGEPPHGGTEQVRLWEFLADLDRRWSGRALEKGIAFSLAAGPDLPDQVPVDRVALDRVVSNLLGNAFKYNPRGRVWLEVALGTGGGGGGGRGGLQFVVRDDGPGFPPHVLQAVPQVGLWQPRAGVPLSGMGLRIAADLTRRMGGTVTLGNRATGGAEARVDLPTAALSAMASARSGDPHAAFDPQDRFLTGLRVLIADDTPTSLAMVVNLATDLGATVVSVGDGVAALQHLAAEPFDLAILDVEMPQLTGIDVIRRVRQISGPPGRIPLVAVTAHARAAHRDALIAAGADDVLTKPLLCPYAFACAVRTVLSQGATAAPSDPAPTLLDPGRLTHLLELAGPETGRDLLDRLISDLTGVQGGLTVATAGAAPDWQAIRNHSHVLVSLAGAVGAARLQAEAEALNLRANQMDPAALPALMAALLADLDAMILAIAEVRRTYLAAPG